MTDSELIEMTKNTQNTKLIYLGLDGENKPINISLQDLIHLIKLIQEGNINL